MRWALGLILALVSPALAINRTAPGASGKVSKTGDTITGGISVVNSSINFTGSGGVIDAKSSVTASAFFGNGAGLTGVSATEGATMVSSKTFLSTVLARDQLIAQGSATFQSSGNTQPSIETSSGIRVVAGGVVAPFFSGSASSMSLSVVGTPTYHTVQHLANLSLSPGLSSGGSMTDAGGGLVDVAAGTGFIKATDSDVAQVHFFNWASSAGNVVPNNSVRYLGVHYNAGSPAVAIKTSDSWDLDTEFPLGIAVNEGGRLYISTLPWKTADSVANVIERFDSEFSVDRDKRSGGLILSNIGTRNVSVTAGTLLGRMEEFSISAIDTSGSGLFDAYYRDGAGGFTKQSNATQWNNSDYDDGDGTLATLTVLAYTSRWFYLMTDGSLAMVYGQTQDLDLSDVLAESPPSSVPDRIGKMGVLIGRLIVRASGSTPAVTQSAFGTPFTAATVTSHLNLADIGTNSHATIDSKFDSGISSACAAGQYLSTMTVVDGIVTGGGCVAAAASPAWATDSSTSPSGANASTFTVVAGNTYELRYRLKAASAQTHRLRFNGDTGSVYRYASFLVGSAGTFNDTTNLTSSCILLNATTIPDGNFTEGRISISIHSADNTIATTNGDNFFLNTTPNTARVINGCQYDGASEITSLNFQTDAGSYTGKITLLKLQ